MVNITRRGALAGFGAASLTTIAFGGRAALAATDDLAANKALVRRLFDEVFTAGDFTVLDELLTADFISDDPAAAPGIAAYKDEQTSIRAQYEQLFSSISWELTDVAAEGPLVFVRATFVGTPIDTTKPDVAVPGFIEIALKDGKIAQLWSLVDVDSLNAQLK